MSTVSNMAEALAAICVMDAPLWRRLEVYVETQRRFKSPFAGAFQILADRLKAGEVGRTAPKVGEEAPSFLLPDVTGRLHTLEEFTDQGPIVLSFNRGHWCPFCRIELTALAEVHEEFLSLGARIISIMPDRQAYVGRLPPAVRDRLIVLTDIDNSYALSLGLLMWLGEELRAMMRDSGGVLLEAVHGNDMGCVPVPATFVIDRRRRIVARMVEPDFRKRMDIVDIRAALQETANRSTHP